MKAIIQRVIKANVIVDDEVISTIGRGLCVLIGISKDDTTQDLDYIARKILNIRIFDGDGKRWQLSVKDKEFEILCVSQFTLYYNLKGNKLDFHNAMPSERSESFYKAFLNNLKSNYHPERIKDGKFGGHMIVNVENDGPVTIELESPKKNIG